VTTRRFPVDRAGPADGTLVLLHPPAVVRPPARSVGVLAWVRQWLWGVPLAVAAAGVPVYVTSASAQVRAATFLVVAVTAFASIVTGVTLHRPVGPVFWWLMATCAALFVVGALLRPWAVAHQGWAAATADVFTVLGYLACVAGLLGISGRHTRANTFALLDVLVATAGAGSAVVVFFVLPALSIPGRPAWVSVLAGLYPLLDLVVFLVVLQLAFTTAGGTGSLRALAVGLVMLVVGDAGYAWIGTRGELVGSPFMDVPFFGAYALLGATALHPTMTTLTSAVPRPAQPWSSRRLALLLPAVSLPAVLVLTAPLDDLAARAAVASASLAASLLLVRRAVTAVRRHVAAQKTLLYQSTHDALTGMANRVAAADRIQAMAADAARDGGAVWAVALDLDHFRLVNDTWGATIGDRLLAAVAARFAEVAHRDGALVARQGGDEFVVAGFAPDPAAGVRTALQLAEELGEAARRPVLVDDLEFLVTVSSGAAVGSGAGTAAVGLLRNADTALGRAKSEGRDRCVLYDEAMSAVVAKRLRLGTALRRAVELQELRVAYQPIVSIGSERVLGCEALLRWELTGEGPISPAEFIPVAEESGLVVELGAWVLDRAARTAEEWRRTGVVAQDFYVSVNVSARQLVEGDFAATVRDVLERTGLPPRCLVLEITESVMLTNPDASIALLERLRAAGVRLSLDDFGTGYSSLSHLDRLPVQTIKLDRSFVSGLGAPQADETIVRAVQGIAEALGLDVVAEGVETRDQLDVLRRLDVGCGQGWLWGAAVGPDDFATTWGRATRRAAVVSPVPPARSPALPPQRSPAP
jgi:diguanylate cyclase